MTEEKAKEILKEASEYVLAEGIETERVLLRPFCEEDKADFFELVSSREVQRLTGMSFKSKADMSEAFLKCLPKSDVPTRHFAIVYKKDRRVVGEISIAIYPFIKSEGMFDDKRGVSLSFELNENYQKKGIMTEVLNAVIDFLLVSHDFDFVNAGYFEFNEGSKRLQEKCGMKHWMDHIFPFEGKNIMTKEMIVWKEERRNARTGN